MSRDNDDDDGSYRVGRGKPPKHARFKPGQSGNLKGRPKRSRSPHKRLLEAMDRPTRDIFLKELYRELPVRENGKVTKMPALQVLVRALVKAGAEGSAHALRTALQFAREFEEQAAAENDKLLEAVRALKQKWIEMPSRHRALFEAESTCHPDDIIIDEHRRRVEFRGPITEAEMELVGVLTKLRDEWADDFNLWLQSFAECGSERIRLEVLRTQFAFDLYNAELPMRLQKQLSGRLSEDLGELPVPWAPWYNR